MAPRVQRAHDAILLDRRDAGKDGGPLGGGGERGVGHALDVAAEEHRAGVEPDLGADLLRDELVVARDDLDLDPVGPQRGERLRHALARGIEEGREADEDELALVGHRVAGLRPNLAVRHGERAVPLGAEPVEEVVDRRSRRRVERRRRAVELGRRAAWQHALRRALGDEQAPAAVLHDHRQAAALEVERDLIDPRVLGDGRMLVAEDGLVHRALEPGLVDAVEGSEPDHGLVALPAQVDVPVDRDPPFRERARLVAQQDVHAPEVLDGGELLDDDLPPRHPHRAARQRHRDDHGQQLGREPHRERHREEERLEQVAPKQRIDEKGEEHEEDHDLEDEEAEAAGAALELGLGRAPHEGGGHATELRRQARPHDEGSAEAAHHRGSAEHGVDGAAKILRAQPVRLRVLLAGQRFTRERRLVDEEVFRRQQSGIGGHEVPGLELHHIARHDLPDRPLTGGTVAEHDRRLSDLLAEAVRGLLGAVRQREVEGDAQREHERDDHRARHLAERRGDGARHDKDQDERVGEIVADLTQRLEPPRGTELVRPPAREPRPGRVRRQAVLRGAEPLDGLRQAPGPEWARARRVRVETQLRFTQGNHLGPWVITSPAVTEDRRTSRRPLRGRSRRSRCRS